MKQRQSKYMNGAVKLLILVLLSTISLATPVQSAPLDLATVPVVSSGGVTVKPNFLYVLDDSDSMLNTYMPDWVDKSRYSKPAGTTQTTNHRLNSAFNSLAYNPAIVYRPPIYFRADGAKEDGVINSRTKYFSQTGTWTTRGADSTATMPNWRGTLQGGQYAGNSPLINLEGGGNSNPPTYTVSLPNEFCKTSNLEDCTKLTPAMDKEEYPYPAPLRWCKTRAVAVAQALPAAGQCRATRSATYNAERFPVHPTNVNNQYTAFYEILLIPQTSVTYRDSGDSAAGAAAGMSIAHVTGMTVNGKQIMRQATTDVTLPASDRRDPHLVAQAIANEINVCTNLKIGNCLDLNGTGYSAEVREGSGGRAGNREGAHIRITTTDAAAKDKEPIITWNTGTGTHPTIDGVINSEPFVREPVLQEVTIEIKRPLALGGTVDGSDSYAYPGMTTKHPNRTDCIANDASTKTCTYYEEMTNYANWWGYYRRRMDLMKTATSYAFEDLNDEFRVGLISYQQKYASEEHNIQDFTNTAKHEWYDKLFKMKPSGGAISRVALARAGKIYANKDETTIPSINEMPDPVQYECQQNFTLLTSGSPWMDASWERADVGQVINHAWEERLGTDLAGNTIGSTDIDPKERGKYEGPRPTAQPPYTHAQELADIAKYYRDTDLRTQDLSNCAGALGDDICATEGTTSNDKQSMVTYTLGLGVNGHLVYDPDYGPFEAGDFQDVYNGQRTGNTGKYWPEAGGNDYKDMSYRSHNEDLEIAKIDDLWHAAVNGDGRYFSVQNSDQLTKQLKEAIAHIKARVGAGAAVGLSNIDLKETTDNFTYESSYRTSVWDGNLVKRKVDAKTGAIAESPLACVEDFIIESACGGDGKLEVTSQDAQGNALSHACVTENSSEASCVGTFSSLTNKCTTPVLVSCQGALKKQAKAGTRAIYTNKPGAGPGALNIFSYSDFTDGQKANFGQTQLQALTQAGTFSSLQLANLTTENLVNYLRGDSTFEVDAARDENQLFRKRDALLGDLIDSPPSFVGSPKLNYIDAGYKNFKTVEQKDRKGTVYVGSNDGMLHAFDADNLEERWAFVPTVVMPNLYKLADVTYPAMHAYYVNGDIEIADICTADCSLASATWKTILVGGLAGGGRSYYALDITDPDNPKALWEIDPSDSGYENLGYTYGNPIVTKRNGDGKWVVVFASGYNNIPDSDFTSAGDGGGYLYVVDAISGMQLSVIATGVGTASSPSGLAQINAFIDNANNNMAQYVYGGDLGGNLWRFDISSTGVSKVRLAQLKDKDDILQPITTKPELGKIKNNRVVFVGTGQYLEIDDISSTKTQSLYAIKDAAAGSGTNADITRSDLVERTIQVKTNDKNVRVSSGSASTVNWQSGSGWFIDYPDTGERQTVAPRLIQGAIVSPTTVPDATACSPGGYGWLNYFDYKTGLAFADAGTVSQHTFSPIAGFSVVYIDGKPKLVVTTSDGKVKDVDIGLANPSTGFKKQRSIWREIIIE